jgi:anti-sigma B factor antagonist
MRQSWSVHERLDSSQDGALPTEFRLEVAPERDLVRVSPIGEIDISTAERVRAQLQELTAAGFTNLILDLRGTTFLDSSGLHVVLDAHSAADRDGFDFGIVAGPPAVQRVFEVAGLGDRLPFVDPGARRNGTGWA